MELYQEILANLLAEAILLHLKETNWLSLPQLVEGECYKTLQKIKAIVDDDSLDDAQCFMKIEEIVCAFEEIGSSGSRHDFG